LNPERDPEIADPTPDSVGLESRGRPGTDLEAPRERLPELAAPTRAGSIVSEFVQSIVEEAQARAIEVIRAAAEQNDAGQREALESADRMRARIDTMAEELDVAAGQLRTESERLAALHHQTTVAAVTGRPALGSDTAERAALEQVAAGLQRDDEPEADARAEEPHDEGPHEVELVAHGDDDEDGAEALEDEAEPVDAFAEEEPIEDEAGDAEAVDEADAGEPAVADEPAAAEDEPAVADEPAAAGEPAAADGPALAGEPAAVEDEPAVAEGAATAEEEAGGADEPAVAGEPAATDEEPAAEEPADSAPGTEVGADPQAEVDPRQAEEDELARVQERFARMSDHELARAYSDTLRAMDAEPMESEEGQRLLRYAGSALGEALTRPSFADLGQGGPPLEKVPRLGRRRRERAEAINTLRRACTQAIEEMAADEAVRSGL
jgi:hypothetical protein